MDIKKRLEEVCNDEGYKNLMVKCVGVFNELKLKLSPEQKELLFEYEEIVAAREDYIVDKL